MTLLSDPLAERASVPPSPEQGVIEEARRRRDARRTRAYASFVALMLLGALAWAILSGGAPASSPIKHAAGGGAALGGGTQPGFALRLWPALGVGRAGWCVVVEEHGRTGGSACGPPMTLEAPLLWSFGFGPAGAPGTETQLGVVGPRVAAVLVDGHRKVQTVRLPGLPYGLRGFRARTHPGSTLVALDRSGQRIDEKPELPFPKQAAVRTWRRPQATPRGSCALRTAGIPGLSVRGGRVAVGAISPFPVPLVGHAFLPCIDTEYVLRGTPLKATLLLDAARPGSPAAPLPSFHPVRHEPAILAAGDLTARRSGRGWLIAEGGAGFAQRVLLLGHLSGSSTAWR